jgi:multicomponent Na+:H+ antiporter subunit D
MVATTHALPLLVLVPLIGAALIAAACRQRPGAAWWLSLIITTLTFLVSLLLLGQFLQSGTFTYAAGGWAPPYGIELRFDAYAATAAIFCLIGLLAVVFSRHYVPASLPPERIALFYALVTINLGGLNGFVIAGDLFTLFVFTEIFSISAYALVATARGPQAGLAALKYLFMGSVSSLLVLLAIGLIYAQTGTLNMADAAGRLGQAESLRPAALALALFGIGFLVKAALFPLHLWLPDAHASAPGPVSALLSAVVVKAGVIGMIRLIQIFSESDPALVSAMQQVLLWLGALSALFGGLAALVQADLKRLLAYSTVANIGYIFMGLGLGTASAVAGASVHIINHAVIKAALFLAASALIHQSGLRRIDDLRGLGNRMPLTAFALSCCMLALAGVPPTAGFVGKWQIALGALEAGRPGLIAVVIISGLLVLAYGIRLINILYFRAPLHARVLEVREAPPTMLAPIIILAAASLLFGLAGSPMLAFFANDLQPLLRVD